jgi:release factor glutamine methyltransferase
LNSVKKENGKPWRIIDVINWGVDYFGNKSLENPRLEIEIFLQDILDCKKIDLYVNFENEVSAPDLNTLKGYIKRRLENEPSQYIVGKSNFYGRNFYVDNNVLIPRPETEILINACIEFLSMKDNPEIIDIGTGSGCIGITLAKEIPSSNVIAIDSSEKALAVAEKNAKNIGIKNIDFVKSDFLKQTIDLRADLLVSNPPYIPKEDISNLIADVKEYEPSKALTDNLDGLEFYRVFSKKFDPMIKIDGALIVEVGKDKHPLKAKKIFEKSGPVNVEMINDYNGDIRVLKVMKC